MIPTVDLVRVGISVAVALLLCTLRLRLVLWTDTLFSIAAGGATFYYAKDILKQVVFWFVNMCLDLLFVLVLYFGTLELSFGLF